MPTYIIACFPFFDKPFRGTTFALRGRLCRHPISTEAACIQRRPTTWEGMIIRKEHSPLSFDRGGIRHFLSIGLAPIISPSHKPAVPTAIFDHIGANHFSVPQAGSAGGHFRPCWRRPILLHTARGCLSCQSSWDGDTCAHQSVEKKGATPPYCG